MTLKDTTVLVLGLGASGLAMAQWCAREGAQVRVADSRAQPPQAAALAETVPGATLHIGFDASLVEGVTRVLKSPGLSPIDAGLQPLLARAVEAGVPVLGELDLFAQALVALKAERGYVPKVIAITGTNGKTTTTMMCGHLVARSGARVAVAGNIGPTMLATLAEALDREPVPVPVQRSSPQPSAVGTASEAGHGATPSLAQAAEAEAEGPLTSDDEPTPALVPPPPAAPVFEHLPEVWVLELSSFQLHGVEGFAPTAAVALNLTQDHLDWHGSMAAYAAAKARVYGSIGTLAVVNRDDPQAAALLPAAAIAPKAVGKAARGARAPAGPAQRVIRYGLGPPQGPGDYGLVVENGMAWMVRALDADATLKRRRGDAESDPAVELHLQRLMPADALRIRGRHNVANALAALALATAIGRPLAPMLHGLREYRGEPHRVEFIARVGDVDAYDDSKGTNVGATVAAIESLGLDRAPSRVVVVLGGDGKGQDFAPLAASVARHARAVALIGRDADAIAAAIGPAATAAGVAIERHATLEAATGWCFAQARPGDAVLLSPACASFDMFEGYAHRAAVFVAAVHALAADRGGPAA